MQKWDESSNFDGLQFPLQNKFIPENFELKTNKSEEQSLVPSQVYNSPMTSVWHLLDTEFPSPNVTVSLNLQRYRLRNTEFLAIQFDK